MADVKKYSEVDLYKLIGVQIDATDAEVLGRFVLCLD